MGSTTRIHTLTPFVANRIAAGEVVERPASIAGQRNRTFFSLTELNRATAQLLERLNARSFNKLPGNRREMFANSLRTAIFYNLSDPAMEDMLRAKFSLLRHGPNRMRSGTRIRNFS